MQISKKTRYALRALFELTLREGEGSIKIADVAKSQAIPQKFLETILVQLKQAGYVRSHRGSEGGYVLSVDPGILTVGDIVRVMQGPTEPVDCLGLQPSESCPLNLDCPFLPMWNEVQEAINNVYDSTTFKSLVALKAAKKNTLERKVAAKR